MIEPTPVQQSRCKCPRNALVHVKVKFCKPIEVTVVCLIGPADKCNSSESVAGGHVAITARLV